MRNIYDDLKSLRLPGMARAYKDLWERPGVQNLNFNEKLCLLIDAEFESKNTNKIKSLLRGGKFSEPTADIANIQYFEGRVLDREKINDLSTNEYIEHHYNVIIIGPTGSGKSYIANALGVNACIHRIEARYVRLPDMLEEYAIAKTLGPAEARKVVKKFTKYEVLIIDEWLLYDKVKEEETNFLLELVEGRMKHSTIYCSQRKPGAWREILGSDTMAEAIMDRILGKSIKLEISSKESLRGKDFDK